jgi:hypothetical protein
VIRGAFPYGPPPISPTDQPFFMDEIDTVYATDGPEKAGEIMAAYVARRGNHLPSGPVSGGSYNNQYPFVRWIDNPDGYADFLEWQASFGMATTHFVVADGFFGGIAYGWSIPALEAEYGEFYRNPRIQALLKGVRVCLAWESYSTMRHMVDAYTWLRNLLPESELWWHNPPGHDSPCMGEENDRKAWEALAKVGLVGELLQGWPPDSGHTVEDFKYDIWDMRRRFNGTDDSPWGGPILANDGQPLIVVPFEFTAHSIYNDGYPESIGPAWADALHETGDVLDGIVTT